MAKREYRTVTIANGEATSGAAAMGPGVLCGVLFPASMTSATMTFTMSTTLDGTYVTVQVVLGTAAGAYTVVVTGNSSKYVPVDPNVFRGAEFIKCVTNGNETGAKIITLVFEIP